jgi:hypothetical protein
MRIFKNKAFNKWAAKESLNDDVLINAVGEIEQGLVEADLGGHVFKKRVAILGKGKSGGARTILAYKAGDKAFFVYGFSKNVRANIKDNELKGLKAYANVLFAYSDEELKKAMGARLLIEVERNG